MPELFPIPSPQYEANSFHNLATVTPRGSMRNDPQGLRGTPVQSSIGEQINPAQAFILNKVLRNNHKMIRKFSRLGDTVSMPKHHGQKIRQQVEIPVLSDMNINDQGINARGVQIRQGNVYGDSRDISRITGALPVLTEIGGRVNRIGFSRSVIEGTFNSFGLFFEYTADLLQFDSDEGLYERMCRQALEAAEQINEDMLQIDLLNNAGTVIYAGNAISDATMDETSVLTETSMRALHRILNNNRTPKSTKIISGSTNYDTRTATAYRTVFTSPEVVELMRQLYDKQGKPQFLEAHYYKASTGTLLEDEVGIFGGFRVVEVENMLRWSGAGAEENPDFNLHATNGRYDIFPLLVVGDDSFSSINFSGSTGGGVNKGDKFIFKAVKPGPITAQDPYGKIGIASIQWYYGIMIKRAERIAVIKTVVPRSY